MPVILWNGFTNFDGTHWEIANDTRTNLLLLYFKLVAPHGVTRRCWCKDTTITVSNIGEQLVRDITSTTGIGYRKILKKYCKEKYSTKNKGNLIFILYMSIVSQIYCFLILISLKFAFSSRANATIKQST